MRSVRFHARIEFDLARAVAWYDREQPGLGDRFLGEFRDATHQIAVAGHVLRRPDGVHRHLKLRSFPYLVFFREDGTDFIVLLVVNAVRDPALISNFLDDRR